MGAPASPPAALLDRMLTFGPRRVVQEVGMRNGLLLRDILEVLLDAAPAGCEVWELPH